MFKANQSMILYALPTNLSSAGVGVNEAINEQIETIHGITPTSFKIVSNKLNIISPLFYLMLL